MKVLFVCLGNICRSPLAEAVFLHKIKTAGLDKIVSADSCGTGNYHIGSTADPRTLLNAEKNGVIISHRCRQITSSDLAHFDFIIAMDKSNYKNIMRLESAEQYCDKILLLRKFDTEGTEEVPDPYYGEEKDFQEVFDIVNRSMDGFLHHLKTSLTLRAHENL